MQTQSHLLITAVLDRPLKAKGIAVHTRAFLVGAVLPDLPFLLLTLGYGAYFWWVAPFNPDQSAIELMEYLHFELFYRDPVWIIGHNTLQAPIILSLLVVLALWLQRSGVFWGQKLLWLTLGCALHAGVDILTHTSDGPLLLFPFDWQTRFASPISYWEGRVGQVFTIVELILDVVLVIYLLCLWRGTKHGFDQTV